MKQQSTSLIKAYDKKPSAEKKQEVIKPVVPIKITGSEEVKNSLAKLVNRLAKSEHGKKVLEEACDAGVELTGLNFTGDAGAYQPDKNLVVINLSSSENYQVGTLSHELRHASQSNNTNLITFQTNLEFDLKTKLIGQRLIEADAMAYEYLCVWELDKAGEKLWDKAKIDFPDVAKGVEKAVKPDGTLDTAKAMEYGFKGWYKGAFLRDFYEEGMICGYNQIKDDEFLYTHPNCFTKSYSSKNMTATCCEIDGKAYINPESNLLEKKQYLGIKKSTFDYFNKFHKDREKDTGIPADKSLKEIPLTYPKRPKKKEIPISLLKAQLGRE